MAAEAAAGQGGPSRRSRSARGTARGAVAEVAEEGRETALGQCAGPLLPPSCGMTLAEADRPHHVTHPLHCCGLICNIVTSPLWVTAGTDPPCPSSPGVGGSALNNDREQLLCPFLRGHRNLCQRHKQNLPTRLLQRTHRRTTNQDQWVELCSCAPRPTRLLHVSQPMRRNRRVSIYLLGATGTPLAGPVRRLLENAPWTAHVTRWFRARWATQPPVRGPASATLPHFFCTGAAFWKTMHDSKTGRIPHVFSTDLQLTAKDGSFRQRRHPLRCAFPYPRLRSPPGPSASHDYAFPPHPLRPVPLNVAAIADYGYRDHGQPCPPVSRRQSSLVVAYRLCGRHRRGRRCGSSQCTWLGGRTHRGR